ncbi:sporulation protein YqfD [Bacillus sp. REN10]|uniref:sporulation protein YqfD n=1 Tax=Bacillus sp. REN10 TaxID=2782541 RepID=UPI00193BAC33|nr:sporulation protein YqfD [Bacillus sp. REN10]
MNNQWLAFFRGVVHVRITGPGVERFLNRLIRSRIPLWQVRRQEKEAITFSLSLHHVQDLRKCARDFEGKVFFLKGEGLPFLLKRMLKSSGFIIGMVAFFVLVLLLSNVVWRIDINGASPEMEHKIRQELGRIGIQKGRLIFSLDDPETVQKKLLHDVDGLTWIGVELKGSTYHFRVVEKNAPKEKQAKGPQHLIANKDAVIVNMFVEKGQAIVKRNQFVRKGQRLVSGYIGDEKKFRVVSADGKVYGETWYKTAVELPLTTSFHALTGSNVRKHYIKVDRFNLKVWGFKEPAFQNMQVEDKEYPISFLGMKLPVHYIEKSYYESNLIQRSYTEQTGKVQALQAAREDLQGQLSEKAKITGEKILHNEIKNGKVKLIVHFQVLEDIAVGQSITQGDIENARRKKHNEPSAR